MDPHRPSYNNEEDKYDEGLDDSAEQLGKRPLEGSDDSAEQQKRPSEQEGMKGEEDQSDESGYKDNASESRAFEEDRTSQKRKSLAPMGGTDSVRRKTNAGTSSASAIIIEEEDDEPRAGQHRTSVSAEGKMNLLGPLGVDMSPGWLYQRLLSTKPSEEEEHDEGLDVSAEQQKHPPDHNHGSPPSDTSGDRTMAQVGGGGEKEFE